MTLHVLGLPHTRTVQAQSHCAYTSKVRRWAKMLEPHGIECIHYGAGIPESDMGWKDAVEVLTPHQQQSMLGYDPTAPSKEFIGRDVSITSPLYRAFNALANGFLTKRVQPGDWICAPFGLGHREACAGLEHLTVETGIGYYDTFAPWRIFESNAWWHWHLGKFQRAPQLGEWVVPNFFDVTEWPLRPAEAKPSGYVLYYGRLTEDKGLNIVWRLAQARPDLEFVICGQGDPSRWHAENIRYHPPVHGADRAALLHGARIVLVPSQYAEPFGGVAIEAMLTGTPIATTAHGAFSETVPEAWRCRTAGEWLARIDQLEQYPSATAIRDYAVGRFSLEVVGKQYADIFGEQLPALAASGWDAGFYHKGDT